MPVLATVGVLTGRSSMGVTGIRLAAVKSHSKEGSQESRARLGGRIASCVCRREWKDTGQHRNIMGSHISHNQRKEVLWQGKK